MIKEIDNLFKPDNLVIFYCLIEEAIVGRILNAH
jgi:hypothetical protein